MRLYVINAFNVDLGAVRRYVGAKSEGVLERKALADRGFKRKEISEIEVEILTDKTGLLQWLNANA